MRDSFLIVYSLLLLHFISYFGLNIAYFILIFDKFNVDALDFVEQVRVITL